MKGWDECSSAATETNYVRPVVPGHVQRHDRDGTSAPVPSSLLDSLGEAGLWSTS